MGRSDDPAAQWLRETEAAMRSIERSVLGEMFLSWRLKLLLSAAAVGLFVSVVAAASAATAAERPLLPVVSLFTSGVVVVSTLGGTVARRFSCVCFNAFAAGVGVMLSVLAFWVLRTGGVHSGTGWFGTATVCEAVLLVRWSGAALTPLADSQPDCRAARNAGSGTTGRRAEGW
ncbi:hypothetical protein [Nocardia carnea]|nr:hypothetical protein [Nocardia carnea]